MLVVGAADPNDPPVFMPKPPPNAGAVEVAGFAPKVKAMSTTTSKESKLWSMGKKFTPGALFRD